MNPRLLNTREFIFFSTRDYALFEGLSLSAASQQLSRAGKAGIIVQVTRGIWANTAHPFYEATGCVPLLLRNEQGYVSFLSALHQYGIVSQIPSTIQVATTGHSRHLDTPVGVFEFFQLKPSMMREAVVWAGGKIPYRVATPEKALLDTLYLATRKGRRFAALPEINGALIDGKKFSALLKSLLLSVPVSRAVAKRAPTMG